MKQVSDDRPRLQFLRGREAFDVLPEEIIRLEAWSNYTFVHFVHHPPVLMAKVLRWYEEILRPYGFLRTHRSHLVNLRHVRHVDRVAGITMHDASCAGISRRRKRRVFMALQRETHMDPISIRHSISM